ncbi:DNA-binding transcriptional MerR regulator [Methanofollis sp. W23]|uniref:MerR family transcriptional regulator n=1 Tax=Methanofollis sp. W23 TaxID=2817849 RepID=UPI001AE8A7D5|nr:MerR family transcriptional regulator [Methanofollis sp. W23]MBP2147256.1 DNA-binding transcriptional MerR regulator [Methanofollis sp. W23]
MMTTQEVAEAADLPTETTRRYLNRFSEFCPSTKESRRNMYDDGVVMTVMTVRGLYDQGLGTEEIREALARDLAPTLDAEVIEDPPAVPALAPEVLEAVALLPRVREVLEMQQGKIVALEEEVQARRVREEALAGEIEGLREDLNRGEMHRVQTAEDARKMRGEIDCMSAEIKEIRAARKEGVWERLRAWINRT